MTQLPAVRELRALGIDPGSKRIGVALGVLGVATPLSTVDRSSTNAALEELVALARRHEVDVVVVGLPLSLDGAPRSAAKRALRDVGRLKTRLGVPVTTYDERLTTVSAERSLDVMQLSGPSKRGVVDQVAAAVMLQAWLDRRSHAETDEVVDA